MANRESIPDRINLEKMLTVSILESREREEGKKKKKTQTQKNIFEPFYSTGHKVISNSMKEVV